MNAAPTMDRVFTHIKLESGLKTEEVSLFLTLGQPLANQKPLSPEDFEYFEAGVGFNKVLGRWVLNIEGPFARRYGKQTAFIDVAHLLRVPSDLVKDGKIDITLYPEHTTDEDMEEEEEEEEGEGEVENSILGSDDSGDRYMTDDQVGYDRDSA